VTTGPPARGRLLISSGGLFDPNFRHTVVLLAEHDAEGSVGVVLTRPLEVTVHEAVPALAELVELDDLLYQGGPVEQEQPVLLAEVDDPEVLDLRVFGSVGFLTGAVPTSVRSRLERVRVFAGYAGWGPGQLEREMSEDAWVVAEPRADDVFTDEPDALWHRILERKGPPWSTMARIPFDPSTN